MRPAILLAVAVLVVAAAAPVQGIAACADVTATDGTVVSATALDNSHGVHLWSHDDEVEGWIELNGLSGLQYAPCIDGMPYDADGRFL